MIATESPLDLTRLEKVRRTGEKITARCPACAAAGNDRGGVHLVIFPSGKFACGGRPGDSEHRREIFAIVGILGERQRDPERDRQWRQQRDQEKLRASANMALIETATSRRDAIIARHRWDAADVGDNSPQLIDCPLVELDPRWFLASLFPQQATIWTGEVFHSGTNHADHWQTVEEWQAAERLGPMVTPATWMPGTVSRTAANVAASPYVVLDFDGIPGRPPTTTAEIEKHVADSLALTRWLRKGQGWELAAIVWTGGKSVHAWFHTPPPAVLQSLRTIATTLGVDAGLIGRPEHPARLPGQRHAKTGELSKVLWLQNIS